MDDLERDVVEDVHVMYLADFDEDGHAIALPQSPFSADPIMLEHVKEIVNDRIDVLLRGESLSDAMSCMSQASKSTSRVTLASAQRSFD